MLFSEEEILKLELFNKTALNANSFYESLSTTEMVIYLLNNNKKYTTGTFFFDFKEFLTKFDKFLIENKFNFNDLRKLIDELNSSLESIGFYPGQNENAFFFSFVETFYFFLEKVINSIAGSKFLNGLFLENRSFSYFYELIRNIMRFNNLSLNNMDVDKKIIILEDRVNKNESELKIFLDDFKASRDENFDYQKKIFEQRANDAFVSFQNTLNQFKKQHKDDLEPQIEELKNKFLDNKNELESLLGDVKLYQDKMTNNAVNEMSAHYFDKSKFERNSYFSVTIASAIIIIFSVISAYIGVNNYYKQYVGTESCDKTEAVENQEMILPPVKGKSYEECMKDLTIKRELTQKYAFNYLIFRLSFSVLLFLAVIYASRIAMRAYNHWRQSENMYLKLNTLSPFIGSLDKSVRNDVHLSLVPDYFGKDAGIVESSKDAVKDIPTNISNIAIKAIEQAAGTIGSKLGSDKESKNTDIESSTEKNKKKSADDPE
ncbi:hypothetical protein [Acinetobacter sp. AHP123]|uniref:hypothetical protein n=1 Tax=Acinetobacter sp. AHP123 TaxID=2913495 RepID=UPI002075BA80|nr:hypothetical protein [Acinetobacter sp. AHP123]